jgi:pimeloyl-ACP methyl ester carboxylesterase
MLGKEMWVSFEREMKDFRPILHADLGSDDDIPAMARRLIADAPNRFVLIGFSFGGYVAREVAAAALATDPFKGMSRGSLRASVHPDRRSDDDLIDRLQQMGRRLGLEVLRRQSNLARTSDADRLGDIACPTLVVAGENDELRSLDEARELHAGIRQSALATILSSGHMIPIEQPAALANVIKCWLREVKINPSANADQIRPRL